MPYVKVIEQLKDNLQTAYRQAIDADAKLNELQKSGHAKFSAIFTENEGFNGRHNRFLPYVQELADDLNLLQPEQMDKAQLEMFVKKLGVLLQTLQVFKQQARD